MVLKGGTEVKLNLENSKIIIKIKKESGGYSERFFKCAYKNTKSWPSINQKIFGWTVNVQWFQCVYLCSLSSRYVRYWAFIKLYIEISVWRKNQSCRFNMTCDNVLWAIDRLVDVERDINRKLGNQYLIMKFSTQELFPSFVIIFINHPPWFIKMKWLWCEVHEIHWKRYCKCDIFIEGVIARIHYGWYGKFVSAYIWLFIVAFFIEMEMRISTVARFWICPVWSEIIIFVFSIFKDSIVYW